MNGRACMICSTSLPDTGLGGLCGLCSGAAGFRHPIPAGFYNTPRLRAALAVYDFGVVIAAVRDYTGISQTRLAALLEMSQSRLSDLERGERTLIHIRPIARLAAVLGIPPPLLGFRAGAGATVGAREEVSWVDRRDFLGLVTAATLGSSLHPELDRLSALLPENADSMPRPRIGGPDVDAIEMITDAFRRSDYAHGGGLHRAAALAQLRQVQRLQDALCTPDVRARLRVATAELAGMTGWMAYDIDDHDAARRLWTYALHTARHGEDHPRAADLTVDLLLDMAHQALHLDRAREALQLAQLASATAAHRAHPVSTITRGYISAVLGWCRAALGDVEATHRALDAAQDTYAAADPSSTPPWAWFVTDSEITAQRGHAHYLLSLHHPGHAPAAVDLLARAADGYGGAYARSRAMILPPLAVAQLRAGDTTAAVATGHHAVTAISELSSTRGHARLRVLDTVAADHAGDPDIAELRHTIATTLATIG